MNKIYLDNAATTRMDDEVLQAMLPYMQEVYGNPSSMYHCFGRDAARAVLVAREQVAAALNCDPSEIYFTGSGTESNNWVLANRSKVITTAFEHHAVLHACDKPILLPVYDNGIVRTNDLQKALSVHKDCDLISIMFANNELGTIQPIAELSEICREFGVAFHTDAVQAVGNVHVDVKALGVDFLSLSAHKFHGPKGVGALYIRKGVKLPALLKGGAQESNRRAGTENVAGIVGLGKAIELAVSGIDCKAAALLKLKQRICTEVMKLPQVRLNGDFDNSLPGTVNFSIAGIEGESLLLQLDMKGIAASSGSACTSGSLDPSHVLLAIGLPHEIAHGSLRISMSKYTTDDDVAALLRELPPIVAKLRDMSPLWSKIKNN